MSHDCNARNNVRSHSSDLPISANIPQDSIDQCGVQKKKIFWRDPNLFFKYFYFLFGTGLFYPFRVSAKVLATSQKSDLGRSPKIGQMRVIPNSKNKYLKNKLGPLFDWSVWLCNQYVLDDTLWVWWNGLRLARFSSRTHNHCILIDDL